MSEQPAPRRSTRQRTAVVELLRSRDEFLTAQEVHAALRDSGSEVGLATVYRNLATLASDGEVDQLRSEDGESSYRMCRSASHHHHLVCRDCGATVEFEDGNDEWIDQIARQHGFSEVRHTLELSGLCSSCCHTEA